MTSNFDLSGRRGMRFPLSREKAWQRAFRNLGSNCREVTLKFCRQNFSLLSVFVLQQFRTRKIKFNCKKVLSQLTFYTNNSTFTCNTIANWLRLSPHRFKNLNRLLFYYPWGSSLPSFLSRKRKSHLPHKHQFVIIDIQNFF